jgi:NADP-dependent 3-hydroxy acid dehydrogenase YdfG
MLGGPYGHAAKPDSPRYSHKERIMITDKVVAITGASSGIGEATALLLAARGAKVVLGARRVDRLEELVARITKNGGEAMAVPTDVVKRGDLENLVKATLARFGRLDVLVNNAGIAPISPIDELRVDDWDNMIDVNIKGVLYGIAAALPVFRKQAFGHFVTVASVSGLKIVPNQAVYAGTKNAVRTICEGLRQEAGQNLRVTTVSPGFTRTELATSLTSDTIRSQLQEGFDKFAIPADAIARAIAFAIEQPTDVDVNEINVRPTSQG